MNIISAKDILSLKQGSLITKSSLAEVIKSSKVEGTNAWAGDKYIISNTPQQGINWVGQPPNVVAVLLKSLSSKYTDDGWVDSTHTQYRYSFKARKGHINYFETANAVLLNQPHYDYPIYLFTSSPPYWLFQGQFRVADNEISKVVLTRISNAPKRNKTVIAPLAFYEGGRRYVLHRITERSAAAVSLLKASNSYICDICNLDFNEEYGVPYIEAHHKIPLSVIPSTYKLQLDELVPLCANCHRVVHHYMRRGESNYSTIRKKIRIKLRIHNGTQST